MKAAATSPTMLIPAELGVHLSGYSVHRINGFTSLARQTLYVVGGLYHGFRGILADDSVTYYPCHALVRGQLLPCHIACGTTYCGCLHSLAGSHKGSLRVECCAA